MENMKPIYINIPCPTKEEAVKICGDLLEKDLCGTAKIQEKVTLMYPQDGIQKEEIVLIVLKSVDSKLTDIHEYILKNHSWGTPCIEVVPLIADMC